ncbi:pyridoxamine 5'-phosphate oxidase family protein [Bosea sp. NBC_00550]|uniref:pyridoxamine 5'-phosphate oxidase family protein n=1 Tax=Bosea sp. NBC_00550 TaxID=2969621 RepID=UPI00222F6F12|nr:pyridoxamine 5'-phosphate oxidase family protein [Bosea sp. NBC_00550]UZF94671.1 pyridoxamine 5'-phosphate oxidase family protein [Bosea sp. NBC_00550]
MLPDSPFHAGELAAQARAGVAARGAGIRSFMPDQHRIFFGQLPWLFAGVLDQSGWPLATALSGPIGFAASPDPTSLAIAALPQSDDPAFDAIRPGSAIGLLGLEFETRRRNRANGQIETVDDKGVTVSVAQSFGNCAKYIQARTRLPDGGEQPQAVQTLARLDGAAQALIAASDTLFIASAAVAGTPGGGVDVSHRGGRPGFIRIDGDTLTVPDFIGNNYFNTLGNLLEEHRAAILLVDFETGTMLQLQGLVEIIWDGPELAGLEGSQRLWRFHVTRGWRSSHALPLRWTAPDYAPTTLQTGIWTGSRASVAAA